MSKLRTKIYVRSGKFTKALEVFNDTVSLESSEENIIEISRSKPIQDMVVVEIEYNKPNDLFWLGAYYRTA